VITAYVGLGSNRDEPRAQVLKAFDELAQLPDSRLAARSPLYRSAPLPPAGQPDYVNAVAGMRTTLRALGLLAALQTIEARHGRERPYPNAPRTLDLDLLLFGDLRVACDGLTVPHPRMHERAFVLRPLLDLDPAAQIPGRGPAQALLLACAAQAIERLDS
jgi:2-amino-4-hydroxy-6-hydroxymethyldihydropteridine diphosphokinase